MNKTTQNDTLSPAQVKVLAELLTGKTITAAAAAVGVERATVHRWFGKTSPSKPHGTGTDRNFTGKPSLGLNGWPPRLLTVWKRPLTAGT